MICEGCEGEGYLRGHDPANPGALVLLPCFDCNGSGIASCCDNAGSSAPPSFVCPRCGAESYNPNDIRESYCGRCHVFVDDPTMPPLPPLPIVAPPAANRRARAAYVDPAYSERLCDRCGKPYQGPAVYCSLECALADA
jgi:ribosomal protein S27AE